jgi:hypothetical protein
MWLESMGLMVRGGGGAGRPRVTSKGFVFLFKSVQGQVWDLILAYMEHLDDRHQGQASPQRDEVRFTPLRWASFVLLV